MTRCNAGVSLLALTIGLAIGVPAAGQIKQYEP